MAGDAWRKVAERRELEMEDEGEGRGLKKGIVRGVRISRLSSPRFQKQTEVEEEKEGDLCSHEKVR